LASSTSSRISKKLKKGKAKLRAKMIKAEGRLEKKAVPQRTKERLKKARKSR
jgi:ribosomal protein RSM22 (predicted rRNA methylase)